MTHSEPSIKSRYSHLWPQTPPDSPRLPQTPTDSHMVTDSLMHFCMCHQPDSAASWLYFISLPFYLPQRSNGGFHGILSVQTLPLSLCLPCPSSTVPVMGKKSDQSLCWHTHYMVFSSSSVVPQWFRFGGSALVRLFFSKKVCAPSRQLPLYLHLIQNQILFVTRSYTKYNI